MRVPEADKAKRSTGWAESPIHASPSLSASYLAQHKNGDVWYFAEDVNNYSNGILLHHPGSFHHGKDGAKAGIWMKAEKRVGDSYRQEFYVGHAEDMRDTVATGRDRLHQVRHVHRLRQGRRLGAV